MWMCQCTFKVDVIWNQLTSEAFPKGFVPNFLCVYFWQKDRSILSIIVYLFCLLLMMFRPVWGLSCWIHRIRELQYGYANTFSRFLWGFIVLNFAFSRSLYEIPKGRKMISCAALCLLCFHPFFSPSLRNWTSVYYPVASSF